MAIVTKLLACAAVLYLAKSDTPDDAGDDDDICAQARETVTAQCEVCSSCFQNPGTVDVGGGCMVIDDCDEDGIGAAGQDVCDNGQDCFQLITAAITNLEIDDPDTDDPEPETVCAQARETVTAQCEVCSSCFQDPGSVDVGGGCMVIDDCDEDGIGAAGQDVCDNGQDCFQLITAAITNLEIDDPDIDDPDTDDPATVDVGSDCEVVLDCGPGGIGAPGTGSACPGDQDCNELITSAISSLLDTGSTEDVPEAPELCRDALEAVKIQCPACAECMDGTDNAPIVEPENARLDALPESLPWAAAGPSVAVAAAVAASLAAALAGAAVMWRGQRAALASARSALVAEGHQDEDAPMIQGSSAAASAP